MPTYKQFSKIEVYLAVFDKDTNLDYILDTNGDKIIIKDWPNIKSDDDYEIVVDITPF